MRLRSQVYSSCFVRHACESAAPLPGKSVSARRITECTSKSVPYASKTRAEISRVIAGLDIAAGGGGLRGRCYHWRSLERSVSNVHVGLSLSLPAHAGPCEERGR